MYIVKIDYKEECPVKKRIFLLITVLIFVFAVSVCAAPDVILPSEAVNNTTGILTVTSPADSSISSYNKSHNISGYAGNGVEVSVYYLNKTVGAYCLLYKDGAPVVFNVGASGMFIKPVTLLQGRNDLLIRAETYGKVQYAKRTVTVLSSNFFNLFKGFNLF